MEVKMNKEIRDYQESMFMGLAVRGRSRQSAVSGGDPRRTGRNLQYRRAQRKEEYRSRTQDLRDS